MGTTVEIGDAMMMRSADLSVSGFNISADESMSPWFEPWIGDVRWCPFMMVDIFYQGANDPPMSPQPMMQIWFMTVGCQGEVRPLFQGKCG